MTDTQANEAPAGNQQTADVADASASPTNKALWTGIGIGSAALVAALMYATKRPIRRRK